jgi:hypothetical protein
MSRRPGRLLLPTRARIRPEWLAATYVGALVPADFLMASGMLNGLVTILGRFRLNIASPWDASTF